MEVVGKWTVNIIVCSGLLLSIRSAMGKLNIAHHKSYHPYRRDNIEKVRRDEEEARLKEEREDGKILLAVRLICLRCVI